MRSKRTFAAIAAQRRNTEAVPTRRPEEQQSGWPAKHRVSLCLVLLLSLLAVGCASDTPKFPDVDVAAAADAIAGVAWFDDDRDERIGADERAAGSVTVRVGLGNQVLANVDSVTTDQTGGFVVALPDFLDGFESELFVQVELETDGPNGASSVVHHRVSAEPGETRVMVPLVRAIKCTDTVDDVLASAALCGQPRLPDLVPIVEDFGQPPTQPVAERSARLDTTTLPELELLRFASATANLGDGPLHMIPDTVPSQGKTKTWQRLWTDRGRFLDHRTGEFVFHEGHDHFHLEAFEQYRLLSLDGTVVRTGEKISFCLIDSLPAIATAQTRGSGIFLDVVCEQAGEQQALNPGWTDYYGAGLPDQWIDVTGVEPGDYLVEIVADPDDVIIESDETNNRATFPVTLTFDHRESGD